MGCKYIVISPEFFVGPLGMFREGSEHHFRVSTGLPDDARVIRSWVFTSPTGAQEIRCVVESAEYPEVPEGNVLERASFAFQECNLCPSKP